MQIIFNLFSFCYCNCELLAVTLNCRCKQIVNKLSNYMKSDKNTTQEKTKLNSYVWAGQCIYNVVKREVTEKGQIKQDKK